MKPYYLESLESDRPGVVRCGDIARMTGSDVVFCTIFIPIECASRCEPNAKYKREEETWLFLSLACSLPEEPSLQLLEFRSFRAILASILPAASKYARCGITKCSPDINIGPRQEILEFPFASLHAPSFSRARDENY